ncbi:MAG: hypothetical protein RXP91_06410, partial [Nitrososphaeria archaeon]
RMRSPYGIVDVGMDGLILGFREKPVLPFLMNGGIYRVEDLGELAEWGRGFSSLEEEVLPALAHERLLGAWPIREGAFWRSVDTVKDYQEAAEYVASRGYAKGAIDRSRPHSGTPCPTRSPRSSPGSSRARGVRSGSGRRPRPAPAARPSG